MARTKNRRPADLTTEYLKCRSDRHPWEHIATFEVPGRRRLRERYFECHQCDGKRWQLTHRGRVISQRRKLHPDYYFHGQGRKNPAEFREELVERELVSTSRAARKRAA